MNSFINSIYYCTKFRNDDKSSWVCTHHSLNYKQNIEYEELDGRMFLVKKIPCFSTIFPIDLLYLKYKLSSFYVNIFQIDI